MRKLLMTGVAVAAAISVAAPANADDWYGPGSGHPCNSNDVIIIKTTAPGPDSPGNAIERWGPKGCDPSLPMTGTN